MSEWQPIETAPKDGTDIWSFLPNDEPNQSVCYFENSPLGAYWAYRERLVNDVVGMAEPTHWMPLPPKPE